MQDAFEILNKTKGKLPSLPFRDIKNFALGEDYELSLVFLDEKEMHELNLKTRQKDKPTNILSFPLDESSGEIFICLSYSEKEAHLFERTYENYIAFLFVHGLVHLTGLDHGEEMEQKEVKIREKFKI